MKPDNTLLLDSPFPTVIGCDGYQYEQIGSVISPAIQMKALQGIVTYDCIITYCGKKNTQKRPMSGFLIKAFCWRFLMHYNHPILFAKANI